MKTIKKFYLVSVLLIASGTLFSAIVNDPSSVITGQQEIADDPMYFGEEIEIVEKANETLQKSVRAFENVMNDPKSSIPASLVSQSEGIIIFPRALKIALGTIGGQG